jgi:hypothetical protein
LPVTVPILTVLPYALAALAMLGCIWLFVLLKVELRRQTLRIQREQHRLEEACSELRVALGAIAGDVEELHKTAAVAPPVISPGLSLNISHRAQILRMSRRGERPEQISAALGVPRSEVELLLKIQQASLSPVTG